MPNLEDINYSRADTIAAVRGFYRFLAQMYLKESDIVEPPKTGWPSITPENLQVLDKSAEVLELLKHLPYIRVPSRVKEYAQIAPNCFMANWQSLCEVIATGKLQDIKLTSEGVDCYENVPSQVISLTKGPITNPTFLLDTEEGTIYWTDCPEEVRSDVISTSEQIQDDPYEYAPENEAEWRAESDIWSIKDFFEVLKNQFRKLRFLPLNAQVVIADYDYILKEWDGLVPAVQEIYHEHGWPDLERYNKTECLAAVRELLNEHFTGFISHPESVE